MSSNELYTGNTERKYNSQNHKKIDSNVKLTHKEDECLDCEDDENQIYMCDICEYTTTRIDNYIRHNKSNKHLIKKRKQKITYYCTVCEFVSKRKSDYDRHVNTKKHKLLIDMQQQTPVKATNPKEIIIKLKQETNKCNKERNKDNIINNNNNTHKDNTYKYVCEYCQKKYKSRSGHYKHKQMCKLKHQQDVNKSQQLTLHEQTHNTTDEDLKKMVLDIAKSNETIMEMMKEPRVIHNTNNTTNYIENYLNIECKDAINMTEFIQQLKITFQDLLYLGDNGFSKSVQQLMIRSLKDMEQTKRPIHCTNKRKKTMYIKNKDVWEKDEKHKHLENTIHKIHRKEMDSALNHMENNYFNEETFENKNNIIINLSSANKNETLKIITKTLSNEAFLEH
jgi:hypothetical protein